jgi:DNA-binding CsgD family transcriptional regulator
VTAVSDLERLSLLVDTIYRGATEPQMWPQIVAGASEWLDSPKGMLYTPLNGPEQGGIYFQQGLPDSFLELYKSRFQSVDMWTQGVVRLDKFKEGNVILGTDVVPHETLINSRWYDECLRYGDISHLLTSVVFGLGPPGTASPDLPTACSFYRGDKGAMFTEDDRRKLALLLPHLSRALGVMSRLRLSDLKVAASLASLDQLPVALMLMSATGEVLFCNKAATAVLASTDVLHVDRAVRRHGLGRLTARLPRVDREITRALASVRRIDDVQHFSSRIAVPGNFGEGDWSLQMSRVSPGTPMTADGQLPEVIVFLTNPKRPLELSPEVLCSTYGLTPAEARLAIAATAAGSLQEVARSIGITANTAKSQLKQVYAKTGAMSRADLVRLVMGFSAAR